MPSGGGGHIISAHPVTLAVAESVQPSTSGDQGNATADTEGSSGRLRKAEAYRSTAMPDTMAAPSAANKGTAPVSQQVSQPDPNRPK
jgi:hypothetical protein